MASIGEYGLDINSGAIANPNTAEDFMSYCGPQWMSVFTYNLLTNIAGLVPQTIPSGSGAAPRVIDDESIRFERDEQSLQPLIHMLGVIGTDGTVEVTSVARIETRYLRGNGRQTGYIAQHLDAEGRVIAQDTVYGYESEGGCSGKSADHGSDHGNCGCKDCGDNYSRQPILFKAMLPDTAPGATLRILKHGEVVWERKSTGEPPAIRAVRAKLTKGGELELSWQSGSESKQGIDAWIRWSGDDGKRWHALTVGQRQSPVRIASDQLPSGNIRFELLANDGFHTTRAMSDAIVLPAKPPSVAILYPREGARVYGDRLFHLWGSVSSFAGTSIDPDAAEWFIDDKPVGTGLDLWVENPGPGSHRVRLQVTEADLTGTATSNIEVA